MLIPLAIPPGVVANGTALQGSGRWRDASLVRWSDATLQPVGGWDSRAQVGSEAPRASIAWRTLAGDYWYAMGSATKVWAVTAANVATDITPGTLTGGTGSSSAATGYGMGNYGTDFYGVSRPDYGGYGEASTWFLDTWGEELIACAPEDGRIWFWDLNPAHDLVVVPNAPSDCLGCLVTDERFLMAFGSSGDPRKVSWSDRENRTLWTVSETNEAGDYNLQTPGQFMTALRVPGRTLILTDADAHAATYIGPPFVYSFQRAGDACGVISRKAAVAVAGMAFWMGTRGFFAWDGQSVQPLACDIADDVFGRINVAQISKCWAVANSQFGEVWFFYPEGNEIDRYAVYNFREQHWTMGSLSRTAGFDRGVFRAPMWWGADGTAYDHETGLNYDGQEVYVESGPVQLGQGDEVMAVTRLLPDERTQGDVAVTFKTRFQPQGPEASHGPFTMTAPTDVRFSGRQVSMRVSGARLADWRWGVPRIEAKGSGRR